MGEYVPHLVPGLKLRDDLKPLEITQPEGTSFTLDGNLRALAEVVAARRLQPPRGHGPAHGRLRRRRPHAAGRAPALVRRDGRPVPRPDDRPLPPHGVRHRRVGPRVHDHLARARLRLPRRDPLPRRGHARHEGRAVRDPQRDLHPRGGRRGAVEARRRAGRRRGPARAPARALVPRHGRELRVPRLLAALPGRQHRVRGARDRDHGHDPLRRGRAAAVRHARRRAHVRAVPPALPRRAARPRRRRRGQHRLRDRVRGAPDRPDERARARARAAQHAAAHRAGGQAGLRLEHPAGVEGRQRQRDQRARDAGRLQARPGRRASRR